MANTVLIGGQWGDEGKGRIIDLLAERADFVVRYQGGSNAGHEVHAGGQKYVLHLIPSGILHSGKVCVIGNGVVVDPIELVNEIVQLRKRGVKVSSNLKLSETAHLVMPYHKLLDERREALKGRGKIGTTKRGIGPAYGDKASRTGFRVLDLLKPRQFKERLKQRIDENNRLLRALGARTLSYEKVLRDYLRVGRFLKPFIVDSVMLVNAAIDEGRDVLFEGAQGTLLDIDFGTYPFVTSSHPTAGGACVGSGVPPGAIHEVVGVVKAYTTRVGEGPFPTEQKNGVGKQLQTIGDEFGRTTGRARRCGWFDAVVARYARMVNGITKLAITKLDVLDRMPVLKIAVAYRVGRKVLRSLPSDIEVLKRCVPIYKSYPGWLSDTTRARRFADLPKKAQTYLEAIRRETGAPIGVISVGPKRDDTIFVKNKK